MAGTTDRMRDSGRGETNNKLGRLGSTRSKMPKVKTHSLFAVVKSNERSNKVFGKRFVNSIRSDSEDAIANNLSGIGIEVARYTLTGVGGENSDFNPSFWGFRKVISCREEGGQVGNSSMNVIQVERRFSHLGGRSLDNVVIGWRQSGSRRFAGCSEVVEGGGGRRARR